MKIAKIFALTYLFVFSVFFVPACSDPTSILPAVNIFSDSDDVTFGHQAVAEMQKDPVTYPILNTANTIAIKQYIMSTIVNPILNSSSNKKRDVYKYSVEIINDDNTLNAFALPGDPIYIYSGLLKYLASEAALAGVLGHEVAHASTRMTQEYGITTLLSMVLGDNPWTLTEIVENLLTSATILQNSRANEDESDDYSFKYLKETKYYPGSVKFFFEKLQADGKISTQSGDIEKFLNTHPEPAQRITRTNDHLSSAGISIISYNNTSTNLYRTEYYTNIKSKLS
jgi:beta-barrel assembly-enhancing protease